MSNSVTPWTAAHQTFLPLTLSWSLLRFTSIDSVMLFKHLILCHPLLLLPSIFLSISLFQRVSSLHQVAKVLELQLQHQSFQWIFSVDILLDWLVWSPYSPRDSQESSPTPQFKSINSSGLSFLYRRFQKPTIIILSLLSTNYLLICKYSDHIVWC